MFEIFSSFVKKMMMTMGMKIFQIKLLPPMIEEQQELINTM